MSYLMSLTYCLSQEKKKTKKKIPNVLPNVPNLLLISRKKSNNKKFRMSYLMSLTYCLPHEIIIIIIKFRMSYLMSLTYCLPHEIIIVIKKFRMSYLMSLTYCLPQEKKVIIKKISRFLFGLCLPRFLDKVRDPLSLLSWPISLYLSKESLNVIIILTPLFSFGSF